MVVVYDHQLDVNIDHRERGNTYGTDAAVSELGQRIQ